MLAAAQTGCLVIESWDFSPRKQTRPEIVTNDPFAPTPALGEFTELTKTTQGYPPALFQAWIESEDADQDVETVLLIDYGDESGVSNGPYRGFVPGEPLQAGALSDGPRGPVTISWRPQSQDEGCHTVTLLVTHRFQQKTDSYYCPSVPQDASAVTWSVVLCDESGVCLYDTCPVRGEHTSTYCAGVPVEGAGGGTP